MSSFFQQIQNTPQTRRTFLANLSILARLSSVVPVPFLFSQVQSSASSNLELEYFTQTYGLEWRFILEKDLLILKQADWEIHLLLDSHLAISNDGKLFFLKDSLKIQEGRIFLSTEFSQAILQSLNKKKSPQTIKKEEKKEKKEKKKKEGLNPSPHSILSTKTTPQSPIQFIVLDAGHGGKDPGNIHHQIQEKDLNLSITLELAQIFKNQNTKILLTRTNDRFFSLEDRSKKAMALDRKDFPGLFVSIHANASLNPKTKGIETFFYSSKKPDQSRLNCFTSLSKSITRHPKAKQIVQQLLDLQISRESEILAQKVNNSLYRQVQPYSPNRGVKSHRPYFVITRNSLPSILVEVGFLSHPKEAQKLKEPSYQKKIARGISEGLNEFIRLFKQNGGIFFR